MFVDTVTISLKAGAGGDGYVSFRHEKYIDKGGPDGGDGGRGGDVYAVASRNQNTLAAFRYNKQQHAQNGKAGFRRNQHGRSAPTLDIALPVGTVITDEAGVVRADLTEDGQRVLIAKGGQGGFGNAHFTSSTRQAPRFAEKGEPGESYMAKLELKSIADIGLIGLPNAGKSTLLSVVTRATPEIADYPFTTLTPNLGVAELSDGRSLLLADIPGLIEGAHEGKGLGQAFLRHIERTSVLVHVIDSYSDAVADDYATVREELEKYSKLLAKKPEIVVLSKIDGLDPDIVAMQESALRAIVPKKTPIMALSSSAHVGTRAFLEKAFTAVQRASQVVKKRQVLAKTIISPVFHDEWTAEKIAEGRYRIVGRKLERFALRTDTENEDAVRRLRDILRKKGVLHKLMRLGIEKGDHISFGRDDRTSILY
jgi:GTP-binding protein